MSHKENDKIVDNILDAIGNEDYENYQAMSKDELIEIIATHEDHHNEHHEVQEEMQERLNKKAMRDLDEQIEMNKARQLLNLVIIGFRNERIEDVEEGEWMPRIDPPEFRYGLTIEPRLANKIRELLKEEINEAKSLYRY